MRNNTHLNQFIINAVFVSVDRQQNALQVLPGSFFQIMHHLHTKFLLQRKYKANQEDKYASAYLRLTRSNRKDAILCCLRRKSNSNRNGSSSLILQSSTIALLFMPPAQFSSTTPRTRPFLDSVQASENETCNPHATFNCKKEK